MVGKENKESKTKNYKFDVECSNFSLSRKNIILLKEVPWKNRKRKKSEMEPPNNFLKN